MEGRGPRAPRPKLGQRTTAAAPTLLPPSTAVVLSGDRFVAEILCPTSSRHGSSSGAVSTRHHSPLVAPERHDPSKKPHGRRGRKRGPGSRTILCRALGEAPAVRRPRIDSGPPRP